MTIRKRSMKTARGRSVIPDAGHLSGLEPPEAFSPALADFLLGHL